VRAGVVEWRSSASTSTATVVVIIIIIRRRRHVGGRRHMGFYMEKTWVLVRSVCPSYGFMWGGVDIGYYDTLDTARVVLVV